MLPINLSRSQSLVSLTKICSDSSPTLHNRNQRLNCNSTPFSCFPRSITESFASSHSRGRGTREQPGRWARLGRLDHAPSWQGRLSLLILLVPLMIWILWRRAEQSLCCMREWSLEQRHEYCIIEWDTTPGALSESWEVGFDDVGRAIGVNNPKRSYMLPSWLGIGPSLRDSGSRRLTVKVFCVFKVFKGAHIERLILHGYLYLE